jgi:hypothetical protein
MSSAGKWPDNTDSYDSSFQSRLVYNNDSARIMTWRNVVIQSVQVADLAYVRALAAVLSKQLRVSPSNLVSLALLRIGMKPAPRDVRHEMTKVLKQGAGRIRHVLVIEDTGLLAQLLITVCRGVILAARDRAAYSMHRDREAGIVAALPYIHGEESLSVLAQELRAAVSRCGNAF